MTGTIVRLRLDAGFGFIRGTDGQDYWFAERMVTGELFELLREGQPVHFKADAFAAKGRRCRAVYVGDGVSERDDVSFAHVMKRRRGRSRQKARTP
jgi:cold shock CspA family protein